jgi:triosephosphate isomerase
MRQALLVANWKLHGTRAFVSALLTAIKEDEVIAGLAKPKLVILPPAIFLQQVCELLNQTNIAWGAQTMSNQLEGAYTGEISALMLKEFGCQYVLIGHSERRQYYGEMPDQIIQKIKLAHQVGLRPILCLGETLSHYKKGETKAALQAQLEPLYALDPSVLNTLILAYEPVWAIGTGLSADPEYVQSIHAQLRQQLAQQFGSTLAHQRVILYGGSVKPTNAAALFAMPDIDGALVGGAALVASDFLEIYRALL